MNIAFWNTHRNKEINSLIVNLVIQRDIDVVALAEYDANLDELKEKLNENGIHEYYTSDICERIKLFGRLPSADPGYVDKYCSFLKVNDDVTFCTVHFPSKRFRNPIDYLSEIGKIVNEMEEIKKTETGKFIVMGDFNLNPYDLEMVGFKGFNAIPESMYVKRKKSRSQDDVEYPLFYNPMWGCFGDNSYPPGTYYWRSPSSENPYWNMLDQVLISEPLIDRFKKESLEIVTEIGDMKLYNSNWQPNQHISDHFPIIFSLGNENI